MRKSSSELYKLIKGLMIKYPVLRDDYNKLVASVWYNEIGEKLPNLSSKQLLDLIGNSKESKKLSSVNSIIKNKVLVQKEFPELSSYHIKKKLKLEDSELEELRQLRANL